MALVVSNEIEIIEIFAYLRGKQVKTLENWSKIHNKLYSNETVKNMT